MAAHRGSLLFRLLLFTSWGPSNDWGLVLGIDYFRDDKWLSSHTSSHGQGKISLLMSPVSLSLPLPGSSLTENYQ